MFFDANNLFSCVKLDPTLRYLAVEPAQHRLRARTLRQSSPVMPVYVVHGFRWPRGKIRIHVILNNIDDAAPEWLVGKWKRAKTIA